MEYLEIIEIRIPENTDRKIYPVAITIVIVAFFMCTLIGVSGVSPEITHLSYNFNLLGSSYSPLSPTSRLPTHLEIPTLGTDVPIINPTKTDLESLDEALLKGVVRYPGSALLGTAGNVVLFGHSSHLTFVNNKAYQALNGIETLKVNDEIRVYSGNVPYTYKVTKVSLVKSTDAGADTRSSVGKLTLVTCDNFGSKEDRYVVEATLLI